MITVKLTAEFVSRVMVVSDYVSKKESSEELGNQEEHDSSVPIGEKIELDRDPGPVKSQGDLLIASSFSVD